MGVGGWGYLRIERKAPQDTDATSLVAYVSLSLFWELTPCLRIFDEHMDHKAALRTEKVIDRLVKDLLWVYYCEFPCYCLINYKG